MFTRWVKLYNVSFPTAGGWVKWSVTDDALTPCGGLVLWRHTPSILSFSKKLGRIVRWCGPF